MIDLLCNVRECDERLVRDGSDYVCTRGHTFNIARNGYVNLLQPQDRRSPTPGDSKEVVAARARLLDAGHGRPLLDALAEAIDATASHPLRTLIDIGCGEGHYLRELHTQFNCAAAGIDISVPAITAAARRHPACLWLVANADRRLPFANGSVHVALAITGRTNPPELARILAAGSLFLVAVPAPDDQVELRELLYGEALAQERLSKIAQALEAHFDLVSRRTVRHRITLDRAGLADLLCATYRGARQRERARLATIEGLDVTQSYELATFRRRATS